MTKIIKNILFFFLTLILINSCYYDVEEEIRPKNECLTENMSYSKDIVPILEKNCQICHSKAANFGDVTLEGYDNTKKYVDNNSFLGSIKHDSNYSPMPKSASKMADCNIAKIEAWINQGSKNN